MIDFLDQLASVFISLLLIAAIIAGLLFFVVHYPKLTLALLVISVILCICSNV